MKRTVPILLVGFLCGCDSPDSKVTTTKVKSPQTVGGYTFTLLGDLEDGTIYRRLVWEVTDPSGKKSLMIRGYGAVDSAIEQHGKTTVRVER